MLLKESMIFLREQKCNFLKTKLLKLVPIYLIIFLKKIRGGRCPPKSNHGSVVQQMEGMVFSLQTLGFSPLQPYLKSCLMGH